MKIKISVILLLAVLLTSANAAMPLDRTRAAEITSELTLTASGKGSVSKMRDGSTYTRESFLSGEKLTLSSPQEIHGLYVIWQKIYGSWELEAGSKVQRCGEMGYLHEYISLNTPARQLTLTLPDTNTEICEIYAFTQGELPDWVQVWEPPCEKADLMLLSTHSDDEQLFFLGVLPTYAGQRELKVQVVYMTNHWDTESRPHEQLNGLWTVGVRNYPIIGEFPDDPDTLSLTGEAPSETLERALDLYGREKLVAFQTEMLDRFCPQVVVAHDIEGEYHHGAHMANTWALQQALEKAFWSVPKVYIHLWKENQLTMDWDQPLSAFGGKTAYEVSKQGYACHESQQWTWFTKWIQGDGIQKASDIEKYSPCQYGLYRTTVGQDELKNDFMEHITPYSHTTPEPSATPETTPGSTAEPSPSVQNGSGDQSRNSFLLAAGLLTAVLGILVFSWIKRRK